MTEHFAAVADPASAGIAPATIRPLTFLDLPAELRIQVYNELLPDRSPWSMWPAMSVRVEGQKASTNFMASCRQVHEEAASLLYGSKTFYAVVQDSGKISFANLEVGFSYLASANFSAINQVEHLSLCVYTGSNARTICVVQDALFLFLGHLRSDHKLQSVTVQVHIRIGRSRMRPKRSHNTFSHRIDVSHREAEYETELKRLRFPCPGEISGLHIAAFLTDPLRAIPRSSNGKDNDMMITFSGELEESRLGEPPLVDSRVITCGAPTADYGAFYRYYEAFRRLRNLIEVSQQVRDAVNEGLHRLAETRIRSDVATFKQTLCSAIDFIEQVLRSNTFISLPSNSAEKHQNKIKEAHDLVAALRNEPMNDIDTTAFGYRIGDARLWQLWNGGGKLAKAGKRKRAENAEDE